VYPTPSWHAEGLRWIASLILGAADYLERASAISDAPCEPIPPELTRPDTYLDDVRVRIHSRSF
jgi:hypothetical protein